ncbi:hypothetical protein ES332_D04G139900v1 [Gossypium tomentosum]|uniref:Uncharacterized protein n=1 Tax=Gossypium tomentosum TaxID=34277 RepID=A0A5D2LDP8_GOSTO|nr:hypothetical protein ES332_D04G139900v1 [Gossypium tomentosum]
MKEPVTPSSNRPTRERKVVERYSAPSVLLQGLPHLKLCQLKRVVVLSLKIFPMVLYGLEYAHAISHIKEALVEAMPRTKLELIFADVMCSIINPLEDHRKSDGFGYLGSCSSVNSLSVATGTRCSLGGLIWDLLEGRRMEDYLLLWIGPDNSTFSNVVLTFNGCEIVRYDATEEQLVTDVSQQKRILKRSVMFSSMSHVRKLDFWIAKSS